MQGCQTRFLCIADPALDEQSQGPQSTSLQQDGQWLQAGLLHIYCFRLDLGIPTADRGLQPKVRLSFQLYPQPKDAGRPVPWQRGWERCQPLQREGIIRKSSGTSWDRIPASYKSSLCWETTCCSRQEVPSQAGAEEVSHKLCFQ